MTTVMNMPRHTQRSTLGHGVQRGVRHLHAKRSLARHLALRDLNYLRLQRLLAAGGANRQRCSLAAQRWGGEELRLALRRAPQGGGRYTEVVLCSLRRGVGNAPLVLALRSYHDLQSAEVVDYGEGGWGRRRPAGAKRRLSVAEQRRLDGIAGEWFAYFIDRGHYPLGGPRVAPG